MMLGSSTNNAEIYEATLGAVDGTFDMNIELTKVHKPQLLTLNNPNYALLLSKYSHLKRVPEKRFQTANTYTCGILGANEKSVLDLKQSN